MEQDRTPLPELFDGIKQRAYQAVVLGREDRARIGFAPGQPVRPSLDPLRINAPVRR